MGFSPTRRPKGGEIPFRFDRTRCATFFVRPLLRVREEPEKSPKPTPTTTQDDSGHCETNRKSFIRKSPVLS